MEFKRGPTVERQKIDDDFDAHDEDEERRRVQFSEGFNPWTDFGEPARKNTIEEMNRAMLWATFQPLLAHYGYLVGVVMMILFFIKVLQNMYNIIQSH